MLHWRNLIALCLVCAGIVLANINTDKITKEKNAPIVINGIGAYRQNPLRTAPDHGLEIKRQLFEKNIFSPDTIFLDRTLSRSTLQTLKSMIQYPRGQVANESENFSRFFCFDVPQIAC